ncbi:Casein kinase I isoform delta-A [Mizuhopecten yessoensis]|uniref:Casein kinase I isoform delta-A n=1 Tax=Mizuhopecten yessoensis TaxID=6573 RepID=A0A210PEA7_MIZYE|nr:Casein kinase I isoform delta-A [Mizuhopecten yessoensis]
MKTSNKLCLLLLTAYLFFTINLLGIIHNIIDKCDSADEESNAFQKRSFDTNGTLHRTTGNTKYVPEANHVLLAASQTDYPLDIKIGTLVRMVGTNGTTEVQQIVGGKYILRKRIGQGGFGHIFLGTDMTNGEKVAVKVDRFEEINPTVSKEVNIYRVLQGGEGFPTVRWSGREGNYNVLVMDLLGENLQKYFEHCRYKFSLKTASILADQIISRLEYLHYKGFIHRDVTPVNFVVGLGNKRNMIYAIDVGLSERYRDPNTDRHLPYRYVGFAGTDRYCSLSAHEGYQQSRRDDMESLGYMLVYFLKGKLPWQEVNSKVNGTMLAKTLQIKQSTTLDDLCEGLPVEYSQYLNISRSLQFEEKPDYSRLRSIFRNAFQRQNLLSNYMFDWNVENGICEINDENKNNGK